MIKLGKVEPIIINEWLTNGPWVIDTQGSFEAEHIFERSAIMDEDYLGNERDVRPKIGDTVENRYLGRPEIKWMGLENTGMRFDTGPSHMFYDGDHDDLYRTVKRNCIYYVGAYVDSEADTDVIISCRHSGVKVFVNSELKYECLDGYACGLPAPDYAFPAHLNKGENFILFKVRPGHFADRVEFSLQNVVIHPVVAGAGGLGMTKPEPTHYYFGSKDAPRQVFETLAGTFEVTNEGSISVEVGEYKEKLQFQNLNKGDVVYTKLSVPAESNPIKKTLEFTLESQGASAGWKAEFTVSPLDDFDGADYDLAHFHFDTTYHEEQRIYALGAIGLVKKYVDYLNGDPDFKGSFSEIDYLHPYFSMYPRDRDTIKKGFEEGRLESDTFYNQPNELTSSAEGLARNAIYGQIYHRDFLGRQAFVYNPLDVFGHPNQLSQICKKAGCTSVTWTKEVLGFNPLFKHISPDGTSLIHRKTHFGREYAKKAGTKAARGTGIPNVNFGNVKQLPADWAKMSVIPVKFAVPSDFHNAIIKSDNEVMAEKRSNIEPTSRDMSRYHIGSSISKSDLKIANRLGDNFIIAAEKLSVIASLLGAKYPEQALDKAWRQLLCGQHHDSITGTHNEMSFVDLMAEYREAIELALNILKNAAGFISSKIILKGGNNIPVVVFNTHTWERKDTAVIKLNLPKPAGEYEFKTGDGEPVPFEMMEQKQQGKTYEATVKVLLTVPALGFITLYLNENKKETDIEIKEEKSNSIENEFYKITADPALGGGITSIYDKKNRKEVIKPGADGPANRINALNEDKYRYEPTHEFYTSGEKAFSSEYPAEVVCEKGLLTETLTVKGRIGSICRTRQKITLTKGIDRIDFKTDIINYQKKDHLFTVTFPVDVAGAKPVFDDRFAPIVGAESRGKLDFRTHEMYMFSHCQVFPANQWIDYGQTVKANLGKGKSINLGMSAIIRQQEDDMLPASDRLLAALSKKAIPVTVYTDRTTAGERQCTYQTDLMNTETRFVLDIIGKENAYTKKLLAGSTESHEKAEENGYSVTFLKDPDNLWQKPIDVILILGRDSNELERAVTRISKAIARGWAINLKDALLLSEFGRAENYGVALINTGNTSCSVEKGGMLNLMLFHTAMFYGKLKQFSPEGFVTERKTHSYTYSLIPHRGSYREADIYRRGMEINDPFIPVTDIKSDSPCIKDKASFLESSSDILVTALKAGKYPSASFTAQDEEFISRGIAVRYFETKGKKGKTGLKFGFDVENPRITNLLEDAEKKIRTDGRKINIPAEAHAIDTIIFITHKLAECPNKIVLGAEKEMVEPVCARSWEHSMGSPPMGFLSAAGLIGREIKHLNPLQDELFISMANNHKDKRIWGKMTLELPDGIVADSTEFVYNLEPMEAKEFPVIFTKKAENTFGVVYLHYADNGHDFYDFLEFGGIVKPESTFEFSDTGVKLTVRNTTGQHLIGMAQVTSPVETFDLQGLSAIERNTLSPWCFKLDLKPGETAVYESEIKDLEDINTCLWVVAKIITNGSLEYIQLNRTSDPDTRFDVNGDIEQGEFEQKMRESGGGFEEYMKLNG